MGNKTFYRDGLTSTELFNISFTFSLNRFKDTGEKKAHKIVLPILPLPLECIYTLIIIVKLKHT